MPNRPEWLSGCSRIRRYSRHCLRMLVYHTTHPNWRYSVPRCRFLLLSERHHMRLDMEMRRWRLSPDTQIHKSRKRSAGCLVRSVRTDRNRNSEFWEGGTTYRVPSSRPIHQCWHREIRYPTDKICISGSFSQSSSDYTIDPDTKSHQMWYSWLSHRHLHKASQAW